MRDASAIETAIRTVMARRAVKVAARDRRNRDMLSALRDVETYEEQIAAEDAALEVLFAERDDALQRQP